MDSRADGKGKRGFLQRSVGSEAFDKALRLLTMVPRARCSLHVLQ